MEWRRSGGRTPVGKLLQFLGSKWRLEGGELGQGSDNGMERPGVLPQSCCFGEHFMSSVWSILSYVDPTVTASHLLSPTAVRGIIVLLKPPQTSCPSSRHWRRAHQLSWFECWFSPTKRTILNQILLEAPSHLFYMLPSGAAPRYVIWPQCRQDD